MLHPSLLEPNTCNLPVARSTCLSNFAMAAPQGALVSYGTSLDTVVKSGWAVVGKRRCNQARDKVPWLCAVVVTL